MIRFEYSESKNIFGTSKTSGKNARDYFFEFPTRWLITYSFTQGRRKKILKILFDLK